MKSSRNRHNTHPDAGKTGRLAKTESKRARGRPAESTGDNFRENILNSAAGLFAQKGFQATTVREIGESAGVTAAMIHYYFGDKLSLLHAVLEDNLLPMAQAIAALEQNPGQEISGFVDLLTGMCARNPNLIRLITREVLLPGGAIRELFIENFAPRLGGALPGMIRRGQKRGDISDDTQPEIASLLVMSVCMFPFLAQSLAGPALGIKYDETGIKQLNQHVRSFLEKGMQPK